MITKISPIRHRGPRSPITTQHLTLAPPRSLLVLGDDLQLLFHTAIRANPTRTNTHLILISRPLTVKRTVSPQAGTEGRVSSRRANGRIGVQVGPQPPDLPGQPAPGHTDPPAPPRRDMSARNRLE